MGGKTSHSNRTEKDSKVLIPYLLCWYDGAEGIKKSYWIKDYSNFESLVEAAFKDICCKKYDNYKIYFHNFANFDSTFIINILSNLGHLKPTIHNNNLISLSFNYRSYHLTFKDSYLLLPSSLAKLSKSFNILDIKGTFPVLLNDIEYSGSVPSFKYFAGITMEEYKNYDSLFNLSFGNLGEGGIRSKSWDFKSEAIKYCFNDCISLYQILDKFSKLINDQFGLNIHKYPTLPSLSFAIWRKNYLKDWKIPTLTGKIYSDIKESYTGGAVDMYIPSAEAKELIYCYDVNSLYPSVMKDSPVPIGQTTYFEGNIRKFKPDAFGFFYCEVETPDLKHPIIQIHDKNKSGGISTLAPLGKFNFMLFSEEMDNARRLGYKFNIKWGYYFDKGLVFKDIINDLYNIRISYPKSDPMNYIAKILMNSLYGRFGMTDNFGDIKIIKKKYYDKFEDKNIDNILDIRDLGNNYLIDLKKDRLNTILDNGSESHSINIAIASSITAYARIHMSKFKNSPDYKLFYTDTDSIYINKPLPDYLVSSSAKQELGKMKLEMIGEKAVFLAPKVYALLLSFGRTQPKDNIFTSPYPFFSCRRKGGRRRKAILLTLLLKLKVVQRV
uniref:DNA polymerase n=1 Tax=Tephrocybe rancida TaxID=117070 RepID=A0A386TYJ6_9AGAR|nr:DNA polymerase [Tephrocybe rancida]YP_009517278.1 DNA polymerase [Tephrocybe rancida]AYE93167.1 DNA polymerase [Tephrocybe rancida]AYE93168.1 DNA polymerase [Tephrocybe rancida]